MRELELIAAIEEALGAEGAQLRGDDAAVVAGSGAAVTSIDTVADGVHFRLDRDSPADVGHKALAAALSDLAAMGAPSGQAYVSLALPEALWGDPALELVGALGELARETRTVVAGGDVVRAPSLVVSVTVMGWVKDAAAAVGRDSASAGDRVGVTGTFGGSGAGLALLDGLEVVGLDDALRAALAERHRRPVPLLAAGQALARAGASAMIDVSDGVATDAAHVATRSGLGVVVELGQLPVAQGVAEVAAAAGRDAAELAASGGEDYELLFTAAPDRSNAIEAAAEGAGATVTWIGEVREGEPGLTLLDAAGAEVDLAGHQH